jgi:molybdopterin-guanine dinucleotide biosynthesis protein B
MHIFNLTGAESETRNELLVRLVAVLSQRGLRVSTALAMPGGFDLDKPGKDSYEHRRAGAREVALASEQRWALMSERAGTPDHEKGPASSLSRMSDEVDVLLLSGFTRVAAQPIVVRDPNDGEMAVDQDGHLEHGPEFGLDEAQAIAAFILDSTGLADKQSPS